MSPKRKGLGGKVIAGKDVRGYARKRNPRNEMLVCKNKIEMLE